ncbi:hypothetical protein JCGZ_21062 [Jatropha curcas]|uniref:Disease resistance N-terminal domain-containing protein n=1 Tax=Jatropha curcas TaxID=180498 RepID=A0A067K2J5_JATCU|nr:hypothetical protein JCGZ_21062 [Jatropha curcas]
MAESFLFNIAETVLHKLTSKVVDEISLAWNVNEDLKKLQDTLSTIKAVLLDAEEQQGKENSELTVWLSKLKEACFDAEDIIDDFVYED